MISVSSDVAAETSAVKSDDDGRDDAKHGRTTAGCQLWRVLSPFPSMSTTRLRE
jgi:hypothetical protein